MLDELDLDAKLAAAEYARRIDPLRDAWRDAQRAVRDASLPVVVVFEGWDAAGKGESIGALVRPLDPRGFAVHGTQDSTAEERARPFLWRFSSRLPARGDFVLFDRSWYRRLLEDRVDGDVGRRDVDAVVDEILDFERALGDDGTVLVKLWLHISKAEQARRFEDIESDRYQRWRVTSRDWKRHRKYEKYARAARVMLERTSTAAAPWHTIAATDRRWRTVQVFEAALGRVRAALERTPRRARAAPTPRRSSAPKRPPAQVARAGPPTPVLDRVDLSRKLARPQYERRLEPLQERLRDLALECWRREQPVVIVYEGWDAAGKGGNIKRLTQELDPRGYLVIPIAAPDETERAHHYLWRFWSRLPRAGRIAIFDRSWYGRVLVERVEGFAKPAEWRRAFDEIVAFERQLADFGTVIVKLWLHVSPEEQLRRFRERERTEYKRHKITADDWRNRAKWHDYRIAAAEMIEKTSTVHAPWTIVAAEDKLWARIQALETVVQALEPRVGKARKRP
jgi:AMP-polyphosphate phosphotransferase